jgi:hypothetical protein
LEGCKSAKLGVSEGRRVYQISFHKFAVQNDVEVCGLQPARQIFHLAKTLENKSLLFGFAHEHLLFHGSAG